MTNRITADHITRAAIVYVRQSGPEQVRSHAESARIQVGSREKAVAFGWRDPVTILDDLGVSAAGFAHRTGFQHMVAEVSLGLVGIILCFEASRLSRDSKDWAQLFELCGHLKTLVADLDQIYDLALSDDRLLLSVKGSVSEYELSLFRQRSQEAIRGKTKRGELQCTLPAGLCWTREGKIERHPDRRVRRGTAVRPISIEELRDVFEMRTLFETFALARAPQRGADDQVERMRALLVEARGALTHRDVEAWYESSQRFHDAIIDAAGNAQLRSLYDFIKLSMRRYQLLVIGLPRHPDRSQAEHQKVFDAFVRGDRPRACARLEDHIRRVADTLAAALDRAPRGEEPPRGRRPGRASDSAGARPLTPPAGARRARAVAAAQAAVRRDQRTCRFSEGRDPFGLSCSEAWDPGT